MAKQARSNATKTGVHHLKNGVHHLKNGVHHFYNFQKLTVWTNEKSSIFRLYNKVDCGYTLPTINVLKKNIKTKVYLPVKTNFTIYKLDVRGLHYMHEHLSMMKGK